MDKKQREWDEYFMKIAEVVSLKSKDPVSKNGCVIVDPDRRVVSTGYNGMVRGADESKMTLSERPMKYRFSVHSEINAILFAHRDLKDCTIYNLMATCDNCLKYCLQAGIKRFIYKQFRVNSYKSDPSKSMTNYESDEAVVRLLAAMPEVETLNISNGKTYIEEILESYDEKSEEYKKLKSWL